MSETGPAGVPSAPAVSAASAVSAAPAEQETEDKRSRLEQYAASVWSRSGLDRLPAHLEEVYGIRVKETAKLDEGVFRVDRHDGASWVARLFPARRPLEAAAGDVEVLRFLADRGFPAERCAAKEPLSVLDGQALVVTEFVTEVPRARRAETIAELGGWRRLGDLLGALHTFPEAPGARRPGGAWHHLSDGAPSCEVSAIAQLLADAAVRVGAAEHPTYQRLCEEVEQFDAAEGLPPALLHPDFALENAVASPDQGLVLVDWTGTGRGPRVWSLAWMLFTAGARSLGRVDLAVAGYRRHVRPEPEELSRLAAIMSVRPAVLEVWAFCVGRKSVTDVLAGVTGLRDLAGTIAARAVDAFRSE